MKVLIALDDSKYGRAALESVYSRSWAADTRFMVVSVLEEPYGLAIENFGPSYEAAHDYEKEKLRKLVEDAMAYLLGRFPHNRLEGRVVEGCARDAIIRQAEDWEADLIVMGSHGRSGIARLLLGSVAQAVLQKSPCSVEIIKLPTKGNSKEQAKKSGPGKQLVST